MFTWDNIQGQDRPLAILGRANATNRLHHAYLFDGHQGVGKRLTALTLAAAINCLTPSQSQNLPNPCGTCRSCRKIAHHQHPDVIAIAPDGTTIKIAQIRTIQKLSASKPYEANVRCIIIDDAHLMTEEAANALLKTLEEPTAQMMFFLITDQAHRLLDTILSRCQQLRFASLPAPLVQDILVAQSKNLIDEHNLESGEVHALIPVAARYADGSAGQAIEILSKGRLKNRKTLFLQTLQVDKKHTKRILDAVTSFGSSKDDIYQNLELLKSFFRDIMLSKTKPFYDTRVHIDHIDLLNQGIQRFNLTHCLDIMDQICAVQDLLTKNVNAQLAIEELLRYISTLYINEAA